MQRHGDEVVFGGARQRHVAIVGVEALTVLDRAYLAFADRFENRYIGQQNENRSIEETLGIAWELLAGLPAEELKRISPELIERYHPAGTAEAS